MRRSILLPALLALLAAGCADDAPGPTFEAGDDDATRVSVPGAGGRADNTTRVWEHKVVWTLDGDPAPATMEVPANVSGLVVRVTNTATAPCGTNVGAPADPLGPTAEFVPPSGKAVRVGLFANECRAGGAYVYSGSSGHGLDTEAGTWQVTFQGRGTNLEQTLVVEGEKVT